MDKIGGNTHVFVFTHYMKTQKHACFHVFPLTACSCRGGGGAKVVIKLLE